MYYTILVIENSKSYIPGCEQGVAPLISTFCSKCNRISSVSVWSSRNNSAFLTPVSTLFWYKTWTYWQGVSDHLPYRRYSSKVHKGQPRFERWTPQVVCEICLSSTLLSLSLSPSLPPSLLCLPPSLPPSSAVVRKYNGQTECICRQTSLSHRKRSYICISFTITVYNIIITIQFSCHDSYFV